MLHRNVSPESDTTGTGPLSARERIAHGELPEERTEIVGRGLGHLGHAWHVHEGIDRLRVGLGPPDPLLHPWLNRSGFNQLPEVFAVASDVFREPPVDDLLPEDIGPERLRI